MTNKILIVVVTLVLIGVTLALLFTVGPLKKENYRAKPLNGDGGVVVPARNTNGLVYKKNVFVLLGDDYDIDGTLITLDTIVKTLKPGQILIGKEAPGFMREILAVAYSGSKTILTTKNVNLQDVIEQGKLRKKFRQRDMVRLSKLPARRKRQFKLLRGMKRRGREEYEEEYEEDYSNSVTGETEWELPYENTYELGYESQLILNGKVLAEPSVTVDITIGFTGIQKCEFVMDTDIKAELTANVKGSGTIYKQTFEKQVYPKPGSEAISGLIIPVFEGVWITISPEINGVLGIELTGSFDVAVTASVYTETPFRAGFTYTKGSPITKFAEAGTWDYSLSDPVMTKKKNHLTLSMKPSLDIRLNALFWGYIGPYVGVNVGLDYTVSIAAGTCPNESEYVSFWSSPKLCTTTTQDKKINVAARLGGAFFEEELEYPIYSKSWSLGSSASTVPDSETSASGPVALPKTKPKKSKGRKTKGRKKSDGLLGKIIKFIQ